MSDTIDSGHVHRLRLRAEMAEYAIARKMREPGVDRRRTTSPTSRALVSLRLLAVAAAHACYSYRFDRSGDPVEGALAFAWGLLLCVWVVDALRDGGHRG